MNRILSVTIVLFTFHSLAMSAEPSERTASGSQQEIARFETHIRPVLSSTCVKCHGDKKQEGNLRLDSRAALLRGGESGPVLVPGHPEDSLLLSALRYDELEMPPARQLATDQISQFVLWIREGAHWPDETQAIRSATGEISDKDRAWWAFQPLHKPTPPPAPFPEIDVNEIDCFVHRRLAGNGMQPAKEADRIKLVRRLYQATIGLPPTPDEIDAFLEDDSTAAYELLVDTLLADQRYGEHWARFWLDLVRYAESDGWKADSYRPNIWRYRDYVVNAFNADKPYTEFVVEQLAGDEMTAPTPESLAATGYLRLGIFEYNQRNSRQHWDDILNEITDVTGDVFLGIGMACARCHDHKFDPLLQVDYFKLRAFFEPIVFNDDKRQATPEETDRYKSSQGKWEAETKGIRNRIAAVVEPYYETKRKSIIDKFPLEIQASYHKPINERNSWDQQMAYFVERQFHDEGSDPLKSMKSEDKEAHESLLKQLAAFDSAKPKELPSLMSVTNFHGDYAPTTIAERGEQTPIPPGFMRVLSETCGPEYPDCGRRRRTTLARWIASPENPLTTRVIVNRVWKQHFGRGIVPSTSDFGTLGGKPTHPELLDWLTTTFIADGWKLKRLQKRILMSATWRQSASHEYTERYETIDPENNLLWRRRVRRLTAEQIRDAMLVASGELRNQLGGPSVKGTSPRRSLYVKSFRNTPDGFLHAFDVANGLKSVAQRSTTTTPTQALMMINGEFTVEQAKKMASRLSLIEGDVERVWTGIRSTWGREPTTREQKDSVHFIASNSTQEAFEKLTDFCHVLLNSNEFLYVD